eukprot:gene6139-8464_t
MMNICACVPFLRLSQFLNGYCSEFPTLQQSSSSANDRGASTPENIIREDDRGIESNICSLNKDGSVKFSCDNENDKIADDYNNDFNTTITDMDSNSNNGNPERSWQNSLGLIFSDCECVICLDEFSDSNPSILTLCNCGENKVHFHYPCLILYLKKKNVCPNCRSYIYYQEWTSLVEDDS